MTITFWAADFSSMPALLRDFAIQCKPGQEANRVTLVDNGSGGKAVKLTTQLGDENIAGSGAMRRCDLYQIVHGTADPLVYGNGTTQWWSHDITVVDRPLPNGESTIFFDFHNTGPSSNASVQLCVGNWNQPQWSWGKLQLQRSFGDPMHPTILSYVIDQLALSKTYRFLYNVRWSDKSDGYFRAWVNGKQFMTDGGQTLFPGQGVYLKLANYCLPVQGYESMPASVIHNRVRVGPTRASVE